MLTGLSVSIYRVVAPPFARQPSQVVEINTPIVHKVAHTVPSQFFRNCQPSLAHHPDIPGPDRRNKEVIVNLGESGTRALSKRDRSDPAAPTNFSAFDRSAVE